MIRFIILITVVLTFVNCGSSESTIKEFTFFDAKALNDELIVDSEVNPIKNHEWVTTDECIAEESTFSMPYRGVKSMMRRLDYPADLRKEGVEGNVEATVLISEVGSVEGVNFRSGTDPRLHNEVRKMLRKTRFIPAFCNMSQVASKYTFEVNFRILN